MGKNRLKRSERGKKQEKKNDYDGSGPVYFRGAWRKARRFKDHQIRGKKHLVIYTDGSYNIGKGVGGWAFALVDVEKNVVVYDEYGCIRKGSNNIAELRGVLNAIIYCMVVHPDCWLTIYTDSQYVQKGFTSWMENWEAHEWTKQDGLLVKNVELWKSLHDFKYRYLVEILWVRGHNGNEFNEHVDGLANNCY